MFPIAAAYAQAPEVAHELEGFERQFRDGARYSLAALDERDGATVVRVVCFRADDTNKFFWQDHRLDGGGISSGSPVKVELNAGMTGLGMVRYLPHTRSFLVAGLKERSGRVGGSFGRWSHVALSEHDLEGNRVRRFAVGMMAGTRVHFAPTDVDVDDQERVHVVGVADPFPGPKSAGASRISVFGFRSSPDGLLLDPAAAGSRMLISRALDPEQGRYSGVGLACPAGGPPVLLVRREPGDPADPSPPAVLLLAPGPDADPPLDLDFVLPAGFARLDTAFAIDSSDADVVVAGPHLFRSIAVLRTVRVDVAANLRVIDHTDIPVTTLDESGGWPVVHDLVASRGRSRTLGWTGIVAVGPRTFLVTVALR